MCVLGWVGVGGGGVDVLYHVSSIHTKGSPFPGMKDHKKGVRPLYLASSTVSLS